MFNITSIFARKYEKQIDWNDIKLQPKVEVKLYNGIGWSGANCSTSIPSSSTNLSKE